MPRQPRLIVPDVAVHIVQRGNNRMSCFHMDHDYLVYLAVLHELAAQLDCRIHAYCLMTNHVHLLLTPGSTGACASLMRNLGQRYVQYFNRRHERSGTLWEGRFRSCITESARYVLACHRYIELNPVRAGMVGNPSSYLWSSHAGNTGRRADPLLSPHPEFLALGSGPAERHGVYGHLVEEELDASVLDAIRDATNGGYPLGSESFKAEIAASTGRKVERSRPGPPPSDKQERSGSDPDLFSAGGVS